MIDTDFIIMYTNALYSTQPEYAPRYDEFRDMFSSGQLNSKEWLVEKYHSHIACRPDIKIIIAGSWFGSLGMMLLRSTIADIILLDIDPRCEKFIKNMTWNISGVKAITGDMYAYKYTEDVVINTSCEHIPNLRAWLDLIPIDTTVILQSNNHRAIHDHINCVDSIQEFVSQAGLQHVSFVGSLKTPAGFTRYMIIGKT
jgi:hypothetical protein